MNGWCIMPNTGAPDRVSAISVPPGRMPGDERFGAADRVEHRRIGVGAFAAEFRR
jgi:hypothetical protein